MFFTWYLILGVLSCEVYAKVCHIYQEPIGQGNGRRPRWWVSETNPCECTEMKLGGVNMVSYNRPHENITFLLRGVLISSNPQEIRAFWGCEEIGVSGSPSEAESSWPHWKWLFPDFSNEGSPWFSRFDHSWEERDDDDS